MNSLIRTLIVGALVAGAGTAYAQSHHGHGAGTITSAAQDDSPATKAFRDANGKMHRDMDIRYTNDVDVDFARAMIPHHEAAIRMAKVVLQHSKEAETRKLAEEIIKAQEDEISQMRAFLKRRGTE